MPTASPRLPILKTPLLAALLCIGVIPGCELLPVHVRAGFGPGSGPPASGSQAAATAPQNAGQPQTASETPTTPGPRSAPEAVGRVASTPVSKDCPRWLNEMRDGPQIWQCYRPHPKDYEGSEARGQLNRIRNDILAELWSGAPGADDLFNRALFVYLCGEQFRIEEEWHDGEYPTRTLGCLWHADRLDRAAVQRTLAARFGANAAEMLSLLDASVGRVRARVNQVYPAGSRDRQIFYDLTTQAWNEHQAYARTKASAFQAIAAFRAHVEAGTVDGCAAPLRDALAGELAGVGSHGLDAIKARLGEGVGVALVEALAQCEWLGDHKDRAAAWLRLVHGLPRLADFTERLHTRRLAELEKDDKVAAKMPQLRGTKLSRMRADDLDPVKPATTKAADQWADAQHNLGGGGDVRSAVIGRVDRKGAGGTVVFKRQKTELIRQDCHETNRIDAIDHDGRIRYREDCTSTPETAYIAPDPISVDDATAIAPGLQLDYISGATPGGHAVVAVRASADKRAAVKRLGDIVLR